MCRQDIGDYLGLTIETACRTLNDLKYGQRMALGRVDLRQGYLSCEPLFIQL
jgi:hypothetical protein